MAASAMSSRMEEHADRGLHLNPLKASQGPRSNSLSHAHCVESHHEGELDSSYPLPAGDHGPQGDACGSIQYNAPDSWDNSDELAATEPVRSAAEERSSARAHLEQERTPQRGQPCSPSTARHGEPLPEENTKATRRQNLPQVSKLATEIYTLSYIVFFAILGTLARVGTIALTTYPGAPVIFGVLWANFGGSLIMGFLVQDQRLFDYDTKSNKKVQQVLAKKTDQEINHGFVPPVVEAEVTKARMTVKKTVPLYIGLATGFCGSYTSFSSFIADCFFALANDLVVPGAPDPPIRRNGGYSFMALLAVVLITVSLSLSALFLGGHIAVALDGVTPCISNPAVRRIMDPLGALLGWGSWLGAVLLAIFPPHDYWRGRAVFSLVFAPLGALLRFYLAVNLNGRLPSFPLGTFVANVFATVILGMAWDIAHVPIGGVVGCQVLKGVEDGFCGCLSTVSTWVAELTSLRRKHSYIYGLLSVLVSLASMVAIMGGLRWTEGFSSLQCST